MIEMADSFAFFAVIFSVVAHVENQLLSKQTSRSNNIIPDLVGVCISVL